MQRSLVHSSSQLARVIAVVVLIGVLLVADPWRGHAAAQDSTATPSASGGSAMVDVPLDPMPVAPSFVRLIRITMDPGSSVPMRSHPGPKVDYVESGTLTAVVRDANTKAVYTIGGTESAAEAGKATELNAGDNVVLPPDTFYTFDNKGSDPVVLLSAVMLPAGHQRPAGITYADGTPASDAYSGVTNQVLGDGVATSMPTTNGRFTLDEVTITPDNPLPASEDITLLSNTVNGVDITISGGRVQVSRTVAPGPQRDADTGFKFTLINGDGLFFPQGHGDITVPSGTLTFLRLTLTGDNVADSGSSSGPEGTPAPTGPGTIEITRVPSAATSNATPIPASNRPSRAGNPTPTVVSTRPAGASNVGATPTVGASGGSTAAASGTGQTYAIGDTVETNNTEVNIRADAAADADIVQTIPDAGTRLVIISGPVDADGYTWYQVQSVDDASVSGWVAEDFIDPVS